MMLLKRLSVGMLTFLLFVGSELQAAITMTTPANNLLSPALFRVASGACPAYTTVALNVNHKPIGGTLGLVGSRTQSSSPNGTYNITINEQVWTDSGAYFYKASYGGPGGTTSVINTCSIP